MKSLPVPRTNIRTALGVFVLMAQLFWAGTSLAQLPMPPSSQFDITGFLQEATLDPTCSADPHCGGSMVVNGHSIVVPKETIVILPASALTWQELFSLAPAPYTGASTGLALADLPAPLTTYEMHVVGNRVQGGGSDLYIAGLVHIAQQDLNTGAGFINHLDYSTGEMRVGGILNDPNTGTRVRLNDPANAAAVGGGGRFGRAMSPDVRFMVDQDNPTITSATGFPMCFPRVAPDPAGLTETDPECPQANRPAGLSTIQMQAPVVPPAVQPYPNPFKQVPFAVGDYVIFAGTLVTDNAAQPTVGPNPGSALTYISAHTISDNIAVYTWPGTNPAYIATEVTIIGTGGLTVLGAGEAVVRTRFEGMTTDPSRNVHLYAIDFDPLTGVASDRDWGAIGVDPGPALGAVKGRWRFRPPCTLAAGSTPTQKDCSAPPGGVFIPPPREMRAVIEGTHNTPTLAANGILAGQYHAPIGEYIFPENIPGSPIVENNFNTIPFLTKGGYSSATGTLAGQLNPWPSNLNPTPACTAPVVSAGTPDTVASGQTLAISASASGTAPLTYQWSVPAQGSLAPLNAASTTYTAPVVAANTTLSLTLTVSNSCGSGSGTKQVTVTAGGAPTVAPVAPLTVLASTASSFNVSASNPANQQLSFTVTQTGAPALTGLTVSKTGLSTAQVKFNAPALPAGQTTSSVITLAITAKTATGPVSATEVTTVSIKPLPDAITGVASEYRTSKQRLVITANSSVVSPNVTLTLQPYLTTAGTTFDPATLGNSFANNGGGLYTLTLVGAPTPACNPGGAFATPCSASPLDIRSNLGGDSGPQALQKIRQ